MKENIFLPIDLRWLYHLAKTNSINEAKMTNIVRQYPLKQERANSNEAKSFEIPVSENFRAKISQFTLSLVFGLNPQHFQPFTVILSSKTKAVWFPTWPVRISLCSEARGSYGTIRIVFHIFPQIRWWLIIVHRWLVN